MLKHNLKEESIRDLFANNQMLSLDLMKNTDTETLVEINGTFSEETGDLFEVCIDGFTFFETNNHLHALFVYRMLVEHGAEYTLQVP